MKKNSYVTPQMMVITITTHPFMDTVSQGDNNAPAGSRSSERSWDED